MLDASSAPQRIVWATSSTSPAGTRLRTMADTLFRSAGAASGERIDIVMGGSSDDGSRCDARGGRSLHFFRFIDEIERLAHRIRGLRPQHAVPGARKGEESSRNAGTGER